MMTRLEHKLGTCWLVRLLRSDAAAVTAETSLRRLSS